MIKIKKRVKDHLGNEFESVGDLCNYYDLDRRLYYKMKKANWKLCDILTRPSQKQKIEMW